MGKRAAHVQHLLNKATEFHRSGLLDEAEERYRKILAEYPHHPDALHLIGMIAQERGDSSSAEDFIRRAVVRDPLSALFHLNLGNILREKGDVEAGIDCYEKALRLEPSNAVARFNLANELQKKGDYAAAIEHYGKAMESKPDFPELYYNLAKTFEKIGRPEDAVNAYLTAIRIRPDYCDALYNLGVIFQDQKKYDEARFCYKQVIALDHAYVQAYYNLANTYRDEQAYAEAEHWYRLAMQQNADFSEAASGLAMVLREQGRISESIAWGEKSIALKEELSEAHNNLSVAYREDGQTGRAVMAAELAIAIKPDLSEAHWNLGLALLSKGDYGRGWHKYEWRFLKKGAVRRFPSLPRWDGSALEGNSIFVFAEQGIGDQIMFASMIPEVAGRAARCIVESDARLVPLLARSFPNVEVVPLMESERDLGNVLHGIDVCLPIASLPLFFRKSIGAFADGQAFLVPDEEKRQTWRQRYDVFGQGLKIGISWRGGKASSARVTRSTILEQWKQVLDTPGVHCINLQYGDVREELASARAQLGITIHHWEEADPMKDLDGFAAKIAALDLVISVDNSTVHISGALGIPTWVLLPKAADWRWMTEYEDTPWYASLRLFRQSVEGEWPPVFDRVKKQLEHIYMEGTSLPEGLSARSLHSPSPDRSLRTKWAAFLNDTTHWYHWGCTGTSTAICEVLADRGYTIERIPIAATYQSPTVPETIDDFDSIPFFDSFVRANRSVVRQLELSDIVVINGEGSLHGLGANVRSLLYMVYAAVKHLGKEVHIINHSCYPENNLTISDSPAWDVYRKVYYEARSIAIREPLSMQLMVDAGISAVQAFDCHPLYIRRHYPDRPPRDERRLVIAGSVALLRSSLPSLIDYMGRMVRRGFQVDILYGASLLLAADDLSFIDALNKNYLDGWRLVHAKTMTKWLDAIAGAGLLVSGRFHHSISAFTLGTPFLLLDSNTPKNAGLSRIFNVPEPLPYDSVDLADLLCKRTDAALNSPPQEVIPQRLDRLCEMAMHNFDGIEPLT